jgi:hypothetical protein
MADATAEREPEHQDEQEGGHHRRGDRLRPELEHAQHLAGGQRPQPAVARGHSRQRPAPFGRNDAAHEAIAFTYASASESAW